MILLALLAAATGVGNTPPPAPHVSAIAPIALHDGVNTVPGFMPDGSAATIVQACRANGNAHSYHDWLVLAPAAEDHASAVVTLVDPETHLLRDLVQDARFDGERVLRTIRFARGSVDGRPASLLLEAELDQAPSGMRPIMRPRPCASTGSTSPTATRPTSSGRSRSRERPGATATPNSRSRRSCTLRSARTLAASTTPMGASRPDRVAIFPHRPAGQPTRASRSSGPSSANSFMPHGLCSARLPAR